MRKSNRTFYIALCLIAIGGLAIVWGLTRPVPKQPVVPRYTAPLSEQLAGAKRAIHQFSNSLHMAGIERDTARRELAATQEKLADAKVALEAARIELGMERALRSSEGGGSVQERTALREESQQFLKELSDMKTFYQAMERLKGKKKVQIVLLELLAALEPRARQLPACALADCGNKVLVPALLKYGDDDPAIATSLLANMPKYQFADDEALSICRRLITHKHPSVRVSVLLALVKFAHHREVIPMITNALSDGSRLQTIDGPAKYVSDYAVTALEQITGQRFAGSRESVQEAWRNWLKANTVELRKSLQEPSGEVVVLLKKVFDRSGGSVAARRKLKAMGKATTRDLVRCLSNPALKTKAGTMLCMIGDPAALADLLKAFGPTPSDDQDGSMKPHISGNQAAFSRENLVHNLQNFNLPDDRVIQISKEALEDPGVRVRSAAIQQLSTLRNRQAVQLIVGKLSDDKEMFSKGPRVQDIAIGALERITGRHFVTKFLKWSDRRGGPTFSVNKGIATEDRARAIEAWLEWWKTARTEDGLK